MSLNHDWSVCSTRPVLRKLPLMVLRESTKVDHIFRTGALAKVKPGERSVWDNTGGVETVANRCFTSTAIKAFVLCLLGFECSSRL